MSEINTNSQQDAVEKKRIFRERILPVIMVLLVIAVTVGLFLFRDKVAELGNFGYLGAFLISLVANTTIILPMPGFMLVFALGATFNPLLIGLAAALGGAIGEMTCYLFGWGGSGVVKKGRLYDNSVHWLRRWGVLTVFVFAATPLPFDIMGMVAGFLHYPFWKFFTACLCGKIVKYVALAYGGALGWELVAGGVQPLTTGVLVVLGVAVLLVAALYLEDWDWKRRR
ncbi:YqaA family protein [Chloroflexota bacterium]